MELALSLASEKVGQLGPLEIRNTLLMAWLAMAALFAFAFAVWRTKLCLAPSRFQMFVEAVIGGLYDLFAGVVQDERLSRRCFPVITTICIFIILGNWMGIMPGVGSIFIRLHGHEIPVFRSMNADVNMTLALAVIAMFSVQIYGVWELGFFSYASKFIVAPWHPVLAFVGFLELISEFSKIVSFTFRLFGNIFAGEVLLVVISFIVPYIAPIPFLGMELFVGLIQGFVFALLTTVFLRMAATAHHEHEEEQHIAQDAAPAL